MKKRTFALILALVLVFGAAVGGTIAYLTDTTDEVKNTFTVGKVDIDLDEATVNEYGEPVDATGAKVDLAKAPRIDANDYKLIPGHEYTKDPTVHFNAKSEASYLFVKVENGIAAYEAAEENGYKKIASQITANGWKSLDGAENVYWMKVNANTTDKAVDYTVFGNFMISDTANEVDGWDDIAPETTKVIVNAYAVQADGFDTASAAWTATFGAAANNG